MIKEIRIGEIIRIENREYLVTTTSIGGCDKRRITLVLLDGLLKGIYRKPYFRKIYKARSIANG